jgi:hypothetical protein
MSPSFVFFILRLILAAIILIFLGAIFYLLWKDVTRATMETQARGHVRGRLLLIEGEAPPLQVGDSFPLLTLTSIGRAPTNTAHIDDDTTSLEHALVHLRDGRWWLEDLGSRNGTMLNNSKIDQPVPVGAGDVIEVGRVKLKLELN